MGKNSIANSLKKILYFKETGIQRKYCRYTFYKNFYLYNTQWYYFFHAF